MDTLSNKQIERENRREAARARMGAGDWSVVLAAALLVAAILGFIYMSETTGVPEAGIEPASGLTAPAPSPAYDMDTDNTNDTAPAERPVTP